MNESISRSAGAEFGQELPPERMEELIRSAGRVPRQRTTLYGMPPEERVRASFGAPPLAEPLNPPVKDAGLVAPPRLVRPGCSSAPARLMDHLALAVRDQDALAPVLRALLRVRGGGRAARGRRARSSTHEASRCARGDRGADLASVVPPLRAASSPDEVRAFRDRVHADGVEIVDWWDEPDYVSVKFRDPDGYVVEVGGSRSQIRRTVGAATRLGRVRLRRGINGIAGVRSAWRTTISDKTG